MSNQKSKLNAEWSIEIICYLIGYLIHACVPSMSLTSTHGYINLNGHLE
jgi:hypothetical protein